MWIRGLLCNSRVPRQNKVKTRITRADSRALLTKTKASKGSATLRSVEPTTTHQSMTPVFSSKKFKIANQKQTKKKFESSSSKAKFVNQKQTKKYACKLFESSSSTVTFASQKRDEKNYACMHANFPRTLLQQPISQTKSKRKIT